MLLLLLLLFLFNLPNFWRWVLVRPGPLLVSQRRTFGDYRC